MSQDQPLQFDVTRRDDAVVCRIAGSATMDTSHRFHEQLLEACPESAALMIVDLRELDFICSLGLGSLVASHLRVRKSGGWLRLVGPRPAVREMLEMTRLDLLMPVFASVDEACASPAETTA